jgi:acetoin utilization deacetylase AcuC-like enzyme
MAAACSNKIIDVFWHEGMLNHETGKGVFDSGTDPGFLDVLEKHPENSDRIKNMVSILQKGPISPYISWQHGRPAQVPELLSFHAPGNSFFLIIQISNSLVLNLLNRKVAILKPFRVLKFLLICFIGRKKIGYFFQSVASCLIFFIYVKIAEYIDELVEAGKQGGKMICAGTFLNPGSWDAALLAAGTTLSAMKHILDGHGKLAYALVRPPGHHAQPKQADGYCFLNNAGLAVQLALDSGCKKVTVIDIDVHYGNGTAEGFYRTDKVLTVSLHMNHGSWGPSHPQNGSVGELGEGEGFGYNLNIPLPNGTGDRGYGYAMKKLVVPAVHKFEPDMIVFVVGQDSSAVSTFNSMIDHCQIVTML